MIRSLIVASLALSTVAPAQAVTTTIDAEHHSLLNAVKAVGVRVYENPAQCSKGVAGFYNGSTVGICSKNSPNRADVLDTIRHEAFHVAQRCNALKDGDKGGLKVISEKAAQMGLRAFGREISAYPIHQWAVEAEAWGAAKYLTAGRVESVLRKQCSFAF